MVNKTKRTKPRWDETPRGRLIGYQTHKKAQAKGMAKPYKTLKVVELKRPKFWKGRWKKTYQITTKNY